MNLDCDGLHKFHAPSLPPSWFLVLINQPFNTVEVITILGLDTKGNQPMAAYFKVDHTRELINASNHWRFLVYEMFQTLVALGGGAERVRPCETAASRPRLKVFVQCYWTPQAQFSERIAWFNTLPTHYRLLLIIQYSSSVCRDCGG